MENNQEAVKIKIISGSNEGAVSVLKTGRHSIGKTDTCDLIINDNNINNFIELEVTPQNNIILFPLNEDVLINQKQCENNKACRLDLFEMVTFGNTQFVIGPEHSRWPDINTLNTKSTNDTFENTTDSANEGLIQPFTSSSSSSDNLDNKHNKKDSNLSNSLQPPQQSIWQKYKWLILSFIGLILLVFVSLNIETTPLANNNEKLSSSHSKNIDSMIQDMNLSDSLEFTQSLSGRDILKGYVDDVDTFNSLKNRFGKLSTDVIFDVKNTTELAKQGQEILLALNFLKVTLTPKQEGTLSAQGYISDSSSWKKTKALIQQDVTGIRSIEDNNLKTLEAFSRQLRATIKKYSLNIKIKDETELVSTTGVLSKNDYMKWDKIKDAFEKRYGKVLPLDDRVTNKSDIVLKLAIKSVSIGDEPYLMLKDNNKYMIGSIIENSYKLEDIKPGKLILSKDNKQFDYFIGGTKNSE